MELNDFITPEMVANLVFALGAIVTAVAAYGVNIVKMYLESKTSVAQWDFMKSQAATAVKWLEQSPAWSAEEGAKKKQAAVMFVMSVAGKYKIPMTAELADKLIEEAVLDVKAIGLDFFDLDEPAQLPAVTG
jgi:kynurenine formamidase